MPAISPVRIANIATHAWTKLNDEFMSLRVSGFMSVVHALHDWPLPEVTSTTVHICTTCEWPTADGR